MHDFYGIFVQNIHFAKFDMFFPGSLTVYLLLLHKCNSILSLILAGFPAFFFVKFLKYFCSYF